MSVNIIFASETGYTQTLADHAQTCFKSHSIETKILSADSVTSSDFTSVFLYMTSTFYDGEHPATAQVNGEFFGKQFDKEVSGKKFAVFGVGSTSYEAFNVAAIEATNTFEAAGGIKIMTTFTGDVDGDDNIEEKLTQFIAEFVQKM